MCENPVSIHAILKVKILSFTMFVLSMQTIKTEVIKGSERFVKKKKNCYWRLQQTKLIVEPTDLLYIFPKQSYLPPKFFLQFLVL